MHFLKYDNLNKSAIDFEEINEFRKTSTTNKKVSGKTSKKLGFSISASHENSRIKKNTNIQRAISSQQLNPLDTGIRGKEFWKITSSKKPVGVCPLCKEPVNLGNEEKESESMLVINHVAQDIPEILTLSGIGEEPMNWVKKSLTSHIIKSNQSTEQLKGLQKRLNKTNQSNIPYQLENYSSLIKMQHDYKVLESGRFKSQDIVDLSRHVYENSSVKAVCRVEYFKKLLKMEDKEKGFLYLGESIERILVTFSSEEYEETRKWFDNEGKSLIRKGAQTFLYLINIMDLPKELREYRKWDFAIVDSSENSNLNTGFDIQNQMRSTVVIVSDFNSLVSEKTTGMVSWRYADVTFYETLYRGLNRNMGEKNFLYIPK